MNLPIIIKSNWKSWLTVLSAKDDGQTDPPPPDPLDSAPPFPSLSLPPGFLLFLRGFINYARIRRMADTLSTLPRTRVLFIY